MSYRWLILLAMPLLASAADISGDWEFTILRFGDHTYIRANFKQEGEKLSGTANELRLAGTVIGDTVDFSATRPGGESFGTFHGTLQSGALSGDALWFGKEKVTWSAKRPAARPDSPTLHNFEPTQFYRTFSGDIPPVMHISPGDTVRTWTVDAGGSDKNGVRHSLGGNPETGPFYIEGAFPGDTLVIHLNKVRLNRDSAESGGEISYNAVTPDYVHDAKYDEKFDSEWKLDREHGVAMLARPTERLKNYTIKLQPMLGCMAVAPPAGQAYRTGYLGSFGGNMDYNQIREGVTLYLPVYQPGALFFLGDGHAAEGDSELTGDALETSMDVEFSVDLISGYSTDGPRAENTDYLMSMGIAGSLNEAMQEATAQLANWLEHDYKLTSNESAIVLGSAMRYDIAEVVDPRYHIVAKVPKSVLAVLKPVN